VDRASIPFKHNISGMIPILGKMIPGFEQKKKKKKIIIFFLGKGKKKNLGKKNRHLKMIPQTQKKLKTQK
jgi:hypothetical protein